MRGQRVEREADEICHFAANFSGRRAVGNGRKIAYRNSLCLGILILGVQIF